MGAKDSRPSFIQYDDAVRRVSESEVRRIREAFKACCGGGATLSADAFAREVLGSAVPPAVAEWLYAACGGTRRGIAFRDLLCGIVVLTKGSVDEKIKFLWTLYVNNQSDTSNYIHKWDFARALHLENSSLPAGAAARASETLTALFGQHGDRASFEQFRSWLLIHRDATVLSRWLLAESCPGGGVDLETPTFYQSLAGVTHLEERDIIELEKCFWSLRGASPSGQLDGESLAPLLSPPLPAAAVPGVFLAFDENRDGHVDFKELCCGLSAACRGPRIERLKFCFKIFDTDRDGILNKRELSDMISILTSVANESKSHGSRSSTPTDDQYPTDKPFDPDIVLEGLREKLSSLAPKDDALKPEFQLGADRGDDAKSASDLSPKDDILKPVFHVGADRADDARSASDLSPKDDTLKPVFHVGADRSDDARSASDLSSSGGDSGGETVGYDLALTQEDFLIWSVESADSLVGPFLELVFEVCHIVLGLRPQCKHQERDIVLGWLWREVRRGYSVGQFWYLIGAEWWAGWLSYTAAGPVPEPCCRASRPIDEAIVCDESFTSNSTEETCGESMGSLLGRADTVSLASAASSSGVSSGASGPSGRSNARHPGPIDNRRLIAPNPYKVRTLTGEGGHLRRDVTLAQHRDFELVPDALWRALALWYGGVQPLPRQVIRPPNSDIELELYPLNLRILRHVSNSHRVNTVSAVTTVPMYGGVTVSPAPPERQLAYTAAFSRLATVKQVLEFLCAALGLAREDVRLWQVGGAGAADGSVCLLDDERPSLAELAFEDRQRVLLETRNRDLTWPEEIGALGLTSASVSERRGTLLAPNIPGATGLHNLGNTCFMNAALQAVWNTGPLTRYFNSGMHLYEVNVDNPLGTKGVLALRFGELCKEVWSCSARSVAPLRVRWCVSRHAPHLAGGGQHDAQEMLAWLLDALHEDLNRAPARRPLSAPHGDSDGRPDEVVAGEAWEAHTTRNKSIMTELFYGQLKSKVRCDTCGHESVRFDAFNMLSLPLPMESFVHCEIRVIRLDGSVPVKYGIRVNSEGLYTDVKERVSQLCDISPSRLLLAELGGSCVPQLVPDKGRVRSATAGDLYAYELPHEQLDDFPRDGASPRASVAGACDAAPEVSRRTQTSSLCMPALFCFKRSGSEALISQSPPGTFYTNKYGREEPFRSGPGQKASAPPKETPARVCRSSPTLGARSLGADAESRELKRLRSSPGEMAHASESDRQIAERVQHLVAVHRKQCRADTYFLPQHRSRSVLFGVPLLVPVKHGSTGRELYASVWSQVERLLSATPPPPPDQANHATDCDDSLGYAFPFTLRVVSGASGGAACALCTWTSLCRGCALPCSDAPLVILSDSADGASRPHRTSTSSSVGSCPMFSADGDSPIARAKHNRLYAKTSMEDNVETKPSAARELDTLDLSQIRGSSPRGRTLSASAPDVMLAIDWDPTALHLRYQTTRERACIEHSSVGECLAAAARPVGLSHCLSAFTAEEKLEQPYHCSGCRSAQPATKKLQIWRLPPILIVHLKRFQYVNSKWIKSQKVVNFPFQNFDPTAYLASVPQETILRHRELRAAHRRRSSMFAPEMCNARISEGEDSDDGAEVRKAETAKTERPKVSKRRESAAKTTRERLVSTSLVTTPVTDDNLVDYHKHHLREDEDPFDLSYRLYAVVSHAGQMSGGHYVTYARSPSGAWLCYNDSSCRELSLLQRDEECVPQLDASSAYLLFYERQGLDYEPYLPNTSGREPILRPFDNIEGDDIDLKKMCVIT